MVSQRRKLLDYLKRTNADQYRQLITGLDCANDALNAHSHGGRFSLAVARSSGPAEAQGTPSLRQPGISMLPTPIKKTFSYGAHQVTLETGEIARQADGAVMVNMDDTVVLCTVVGSKQPRQPARTFSRSPSITSKRPTRRARFPAAFSSARAGLRRKRRSPPPDRPPDPPAVPGWLLQRGAGRGDGHVGQSGSRSGHPGADRRVGRTDPVRHSVQRADRRARGSATSTVSTS